MTTMIKKTSSLTNELLAELLTAQKSPCISLYQPTHRQYPENQQDQIRFRNLVKKLRESLGQKYPTVKSEWLLEPFDALANDNTFWAHALDGLAVFAGGNGFFQVLRFQQTVSELAIVADSFHTKPLRRFLQSVDRYQILGLSQQKICFFEGNRHVLDEINLAPGIPRTMAEALGSELTEPHQTVSSYGGVGASRTPMRHGHGGKSDEKDIDAERVFRAIDRIITEQYSRPSRLPLILAALPEHHNLFRKVSQNPRLVAEGIEFYPDSLSNEELRTQAWRVIEPHYQQQLNTLIEGFKQARSNGTASDDLLQIAQAAVAGRVSILLVEADRLIPGQLNHDTGQINHADLSDPQIGDLLDDIGEVVSKNDGRMVVIPAAQMPTQTGLAAIYRY